MICRLNSLLVKHFYLKMRINKAKNIEINFSGTGSGTESQRPGGGGGCPFKNERMLIHKNTFKQI